MLRGGRLVLAEVSFRLEPGQALEVTGRNGTGKSTLLRALAGFLPLQAGHIRLESQNEPDEGTPVGERTHYVGHADGLKAALTARDNLDAAAALAGEPALPPEAALARLGLAHVLDLPVAYLSAGQRRRVALARLLTAARPLWLLDEPATALDQGSQAMFAEVMAEHRADGGLIVAATHAPLGLADLRELRLEA